MQYNHKQVEKKWQEYWKKKQTFRVAIDPLKPKYYVLDMFPYPSGAGLHVGHPLGYIASDIYSRYQRLKGYNVLHPMGYDSFGLPAEQYAIQTGQHPKITTENNINIYREQLERLGFSFDWSRELRTSDPSYYKWTQWIFSLLFNSWYNIKINKAQPIIQLEKLFAEQGNTDIQANCDENTPIFSAKQWNAYSQEQQQKVLLHYRMAYLAETQTNWCPKLGTVLANDEIVNGVSVRGGYPVIRKKMMQWNIRITAYAERLLQGLEQLQWSNALKESQRYWIGKSVGAEISFQIKGYDETVKIFTTRPDTVYGVSFITLAPELELALEITSLKQKQTVKNYIEQSSKKSEIDRISETKKISGVFTGTYAIHPLTKKEIPIWVGDYVLANYGSGAVMAVPCGDQRDFLFANHFNIPIINIFANINTLNQAYESKEDIVYQNSELLNGLDYKKGLEKIISFLENKKVGKAKVNYRLRDAIFSRQRYWGEPFPIYYKENIPHLIEDKYLPIKLPEVKEYKPTLTGEPPLGNAKKWAWDIKKQQIVNNNKIDQKTVFPMELNTMPGWAGSSWYFNRYMDPNNEKVFTSKEALGYWKNIDIYIGGSEHSTGHLLYARFWQMFLYDRGYVPTEIFAKKLINQGMILGNSALIHKDINTNVFYSKDMIKQNKETVAIHVDISMIDASDKLDIERFKNWMPDYKNAEFITEKDGSFKVIREVEKMSKSKFNVVNPNDICEKYGADTLRLYEMFLGPLEQYKPWNTSGITGVYSFLKKLWKLFYDKDKLRVTQQMPTVDNLKTLHKTIKKVEEDMHNFSFNTSVSTFMICVNELLAQKCSSKNILEPLIILISPYAPHIASELWTETLGNQQELTTVEFPTFEKKYLIETTKEYPISFNGKLKFKKEYPLDMDTKEIEKDILSNTKIQEYLQGNTPKKVIIVPNKIINIVG